MRLILFPIVTRRFDDNSLGVTDVNIEVANGRHPETEMAAILDSLTFAN